MKEKVIEVRIRGKAVEDVEKLREKRGFYSNAQVVGAALKTYNTLLQYSKKDPCGTDLLTVKVIVPQRLRDKMLCQEYSVELPLNHL